MLDQTVVSDAKSLSKSKPVKTYSSEWCLFSVVLEFYEAVTCHLDILRLQASRGNSYSLEAAKLFKIFNPKVTELHIKK